MFAAAMTLAACTAELKPEKVVSFTAYADGAPEAKAVLGLNNSSKPQTFWENGDAINVFTSGDGETSSGAGYQFTTTLGSNSTTAEFSYAGDDFKSGKFFAIYPYKNHSRGVNYTGTSGSYRMAGVKIPESQTLVAGSFDKSAGVAIAFSEGGSSLEFKNAVALIKFRVAESDIINGRIETDSPIAGTFRADVDINTYALSLETYSGAPTYNSVDFTINGTNPLPTGTDYYVALRPTQIGSKLKIYLNGNLVKTITSDKLPELKRNKIYNLGTLSTPDTPAVETKTLTFDFSGDPLSGWPVSDKWKTAPGELSCTYPLDGVDYTFFLTDCGNAAQARVAWVKDKGGLILYAAWRYVGLPAIAGFKLVRVTGVMCLATNSKRQAGIVTAVAEDNTQGSIAELHEFVSGGESAGWTTNGSTYTFNLEGTAANTVYYLMCTNTSIGVSSLELVYEKVN